MLLVELGRSMVQAEERFRHYILALLLKNGAILLVIISLWLSDALEFAIVARSLCLLYLIVGILIIGYEFYRDIATKGTLWFAQLRTERELLSQFFNATSWLIAYTVVLAAFNRMDILMLSRFASTVELANYGVALQYYTMAMIMLGSVHAVLRPKFSRIDMQDVNRQRSFLDKWLRISIWIGIPILIFILFGKPLFILVNGVQYEDSFVVLAIMSVGIWFSLMLSPLVNILISRKDFKFLFNLSAVAFIVSLIANYIGVRAWGAVGAAISLILVHNIIMHVPILWKVQKG